jgi:hypothetical protein
MQWTSLTIGKLHCHWTPQECTSRFADVIVKNLRACTVLQHLQEHNSCCKHWDTQLTLLTEHKAAAPPANFNPRILLAQREAEQLEAPIPGTPRWSDSHEQPEHQALLLEHAVRELMSLLFHLSLSAERDQGLLLVQDASVIDRVLRGDWEYLLLESRHCVGSKMHISPVMLCEQLSLLSSLWLPQVEKKEAEGFIRERIMCALTRGSASTSEYTGRCLPRKYIWTDSQ